MCVNFLSFVQLKGKNPYTFKSIYITIFPNAERRLLSLNFVYTNVLISSASLPLGSNAQFFFGEPHFRYFTLY